MESTPTEIAVCAAQQFYGSDRIEVSNLEISRPLEIGRKQISELSTILSPETGDLEIRSRERLTDDDWTIHVRARVRKLTPAEVASLKPLRVRVVTARAGDTVATLAGRMMGTERKLDLFRLINAMTATSTVRPGEKFKIISE